MMGSKVDLHNTIAAIATPSGNGAIGIIRVSGPEARSILEKLWKGRPSVLSMEPRKIYVGQVWNLEDGSLLDQVLVFTMPSPFSYTGEDLIEIQAHGGQCNLELLLHQVVKAGARLAEPGEFTRRAFLNGRMDLTQAEAVADVIQAASEKAVLLAGRQMEGNLSQYVQKLRNDLKVMRAQMEAMIDFPEDEDVQALHDDEIIERTMILQEKIGKLLSTYEEGRLLKEGLRVAIVGKPNVGKSSLFNALLEQDRAIVHPTAGTTRDLIEEALSLQGILVRFIDTAGIRQGEGPIELEGIRRSKERLQQADLVLVVVDSSQPLDHADSLVFEAVSGRRSLCLYNKVDLAPSFSVDTLENRGLSVLPVSAKEGRGIDSLKEAILDQFVKRDFQGTSDLVLTNLRHKMVLERGLEALKGVVTAVREKQHLDLLVSDLTVATDHLGEITGEVTNDEILGEIFSKFCIGK